MMATIEAILNITPLNRRQRYTIVNELWRDFAQEIPSCDLQAYFHYYEDQCHHALHEQGKHLLVRTHKHIVEISQQMETDSSRENIKSSLTSLFKCSDRSNEEEVLNNSVDLAARLYLMVNVGTSKSTVTRGTTLSWNTGSVKERLALHFNEPPTLSDKDIRFEKVFIAPNLENIAGIKICWTSNLADHLRMVDDDDKLVAIFHHATFLKHQTSSLYPVGLIEETLRTLALLFPQNDKQTRKWLDSLPDDLHIDRQLNRCGKLRLHERQIETYHFWHDRLIILKQAFDDSRPARLSQWWHDRRNGYQWYTFWVAVFVLFLTIFFGLVQSIEGALQVYKAYHPTLG